MPHRIASLEAGAYDARNRRTHAMTADPTWEQVRAAVEALAATPRDVRLDTVVLTAADGSHLMLDGSDGLFYVLAQRADGSQLQLIDRGKPEKEVEVIVGGVVTPLPACYLCDEATALRVARRFYDHGGPDGSVGWEEV